MINNWISLFASGLVLSTIQAVAALPWLAALTLNDYASLLRFGTWLKILPRTVMGLVITAALIALGLNYEQEPEMLTTVGRFYGAALYTQLVLDFFVLTLGLLLLVWPRGAAVAGAAFREGVRQPMFWFFTVFATLIMLVMPYIPYFTFGEDLKMVKELGYDVIMLAAAAFGVLAASISISEEIEGRTAITLMSKPVSRRQFLIGKFLGILMASLLMTGLLSIVYLLVLWYKPIYDREPVGAPLVLLYRVGLWENTIGSVNVHVFGGVAWWFVDALVASPGLILGFCQGMVLLAIAVALATRVPMVVNVVSCLVVFFLGHLTPVLAQVSQNRLALVHFMAQLFDTLLPGLDLFNIGPALTREALPPPGEFAVYVGSVAGYAILYTAIALLLGLILFEDRDLA
jgi:hypothetical protein